MGESHADTRVLLIGGTSHAGKSTLAQAIAERLGWQYRSTDKLARHPGRPWAPEGGAVPDHVADHYRSLSVDELLADVLCHYAGNVWPLARALIATHAQDATEPCLGPVAGAGGDVARRRRAIDLAGGEPAARRGAHSSGESARFSELE
jgi:hypothetical protein